MRRAFLPAVVSTSGRIHGDLLRLLYLLADNKTKRHFRDLDEAIDVDSEASTLSPRPDAFMGNFFACYISPDVALYSLLSFFVLLCVSP